MKIYAEFQHINRQSSLYSYYYYYFMFPEIYFIYHENKSVHEINKNCVLKTATLY